MTRPPRPIPPRRPAVQQLFAALGFSMAGGRFLMRQRPARFQVTMIAVTVVAFALAGVPAVHWGAMLAIGLAGLAVEAVNTAIEITVDRISPEISAYGKNAKDLGSFAVFCTLLIFAGHALWALWLHVGG